MTLPFWTLVLLLVTPWLCGVVVVRLTGWSAVAQNRAPDRAGAFARQWLTGCGCVALVTWVWLLLGRPVPGTWLAPVMAVAALALLRVCVPRTVAPASSVAPRAPAWERLLYCGTLTGLSAWIALRLLALNAKTPVLYGDEANIFAQKAKAMLTTDDVLAEPYRIEQFWLGTQHADYPLFDSMLHAWVYAGAGRITLVDNRLPIQMFTFALLLALASALRQHVRPAVAAALCVAFFGARIFDLNIGPSRAEMILLTSATLVLDSWWRVERARGTADRGAALRLGCLAVALMLWAKNEGMLLLVALAGAWALAWLIGAIPRRWPATKWDWPWLAIPPLLVVAQSAFNSVIDVRNDLFDESTGGTGLSFFERAQHQFADRWVTVLDYYWNELIFDPRLLAWLIPMFLVAFVLRPLRHTRSPILVICAAVLAALTGYQIVYLATPHDLAWHLPTAADRTVLHVVPWATVGLAACLASCVPRLRRHDAVAVDSDASL